MIIIAGANITLYHQLRVMRVTSRTVSKKPRRGVRRDPRC